MQNTPPIKYWYPHTKSHATMLPVRGATSGRDPTTTSHSALSFQKDQEKHLAHSIAAAVNTTSNPSSLLSSLPSSLLLPSVLRALDLLPRPSSALLLFRSARTLLPSSSLLPLASKTVSILSRSRDLSPAFDLLFSLPPSALHDRLLNPLIRALARSGDLRAANDLLHRMLPAFHVAPSVFSFNSLLAGFLRRGRTNSALRLFGEMPLAGVSPNVCTFNTMIRGFCLNSMVDEGFLFFREMCRRGCEPDVVTYNTLLDGLCRAGKIEIARNLFDGMRSKGDGLAPNVVSYTTVIRGYFRKLRVEEALELFEEMVGIGVKPTKITYNTIIQGLCTARRMDLVKVILERAADAGGGGGFKPDTCTFNEIIAIHCNVGHVEDAMKVFDGMLQLRVKPDSATYTSLMRGLCIIGEFGRAEALVDELLEKEVLLKKGGCVPLMAAYNPVFEYLCQNGNAEKAGILFRQLLDRKATVDVVAFKTLILGHLKEGQFRKAYELVALMVRRDLVLDVETYETLIKGFLGKKKMAFAWKALRRMLDIGHRPSTEIFHSVLAELLKKDAFAKAAGDVVMVMMERKVRQSIDLSTEVVIVLFRNGLTDRAFETVRLIYDKGYFVHMEKVATFLCEGRSFSEAGKLLVFCLEKQQNLDGELYRLVMNGLCATGRVLDAFELFYEINEKGVLSNAYRCLNDLKLALEKTGRAKEAEFVSKQMARTSPSGGVD